MYLAVHKVLKDKEASWNEIPAFAKAFKDFEKKVSVIDETRLVQERQVTGITVDKAAVKDKMAVLASAMGSAIMAYATDQENGALYEAVNYSLSEIKYASDTAAHDRAQRISNEVKAILPSLADYGISRSDLTALQNAITAYAALLPAPRTAKSTSKAATTGLVVVFRSADGILKNKLDKMMVQFTEDDPDFYRVYTNARMIIDSGIRHEDDEGGEDSGERPEGE